MLKHLGLGLLLGTGLVSTAWAQGSTRFDGHYMGELVLTKVIDGDCTQPPLGANYPLIVSNGDVRFVYAPRFATTLNGQVQEDGTFDASSPVSRGSVRMTGQIAGNHVTAVIVSPSCRYSFETSY